MTIPQRVLARAEGDQVSRNHFVKTVLLLFGFLLASIHLAEAQQPPTISRLVYLGNEQFSWLSPRENAFFDQLRGHGWLVEHEHDLAYDASFPEHLLRASCLRKRKSLRD